MDLRPTVLYFSPRLTMALTSFHRASLAAIVLISLPRLFSQNDLYALTRLIRSEDLGNRSSKLDSDHERLIQLHQIEERSSARLELLHIPKTGGTMLEVMAAKHGVVWGACHFDFGWKMLPRNVLKDCPPIDHDTSVKITAEMVLWHYPLHAWPNTTAYHRGYDALLDKELVGKEKHFFVVVRNPYDKILSLFYMRAPRDIRRDPAAMNKWVTEHIQQEMDSFCSNGCAMTPQHDFVYDELNNRTRMVHHILRFEHLKDDFNVIKHWYNLSKLEIPTEKVNGRLSNERFPVLDETHFDNETLRMIHTLYKKDFELGSGYPKLKGGHQSVNQE